MGRGNDDAIVLGADLEGLAAAATLAAAGRTVHLVDDGTPLGGLAAARELHPGFRAPGLLIEASWVRRRLLAQLELKLAWRSSADPILVFGEPGATSEARGPLVLPPDAQAAAQHLGPDGAQYKTWRAFIDRLSSLVGDLVDEGPPRADIPSKGELLRLGKQALRLRSLGERDMLELLRIVTLPAWDWTEELFEDERLRAGLIAPVLAGTRVGPRGAGTTALMILRECLRGVEPSGGLAALADALTGRCRALGVQFHEGRRARRISCEGNRFRALELEDGSSIEGSLLLSALDPGRTLLDLLEPGALPKAVEREVLHWRTRGSSAILLLAHSVTPAFIGCAQAPARFLSSASRLELERTADALKYRELPGEVGLDGRIWTSTDAGCAPTGGSTMVIHVHGIPHALEGGWDEEARANLRKCIHSALERVAPGAAASAVAEQLLTPADLEVEFGHAGGHLYRGEMALDQLWAQRPSLELSGYGTPIAGLYLGGAGAHPGGPFHTGAGILAARTALKS